MIKCISYWSMAGGLQGDCPWDKALAEAQSAGFAGMEAAIGLSGILTPKTDETTCRQYRQLAAQQGVAVQTLASGMSWSFSPTHPDGDIRRQSIELHQQALQRAAWLGCSSMLFVPGAIHIPWDPSYPPVPYEAAMRWAKEATSRLAQTAQRVGVELCVENVWNGLFYSPLEFRDFIDSIDSAAVGVYFDVANVLGYHQHPPHWIELLGKRIRRVHCKDYKISVGGLNGFCELMEGDMPWRDTIRALRDIGYDRTLVAEMLPWKAGQIERTSLKMNEIMAM